MMLTDHSSKLLYVNKLAGVKISVEDLKNYSREELSALADEIKTEIAVIKSSIAGHEIQIISGVGEEEKTRLKLSSKKMVVAKHFKELFLQRVYAQIKTLDQRRKVVKDAEKHIRMQSWERRFVEAAREILPEEIFQTIVNEVGKQEGDR